MPDAMRQSIPTPSALLELREERQVAHEGYDFLDEKRLLLAAQLLRTLDRYEELWLEFMRRHDDARSSFSMALERRGLHDLQAYPSMSLEDARVAIDSRSFLNVTLVEGVLQRPSEPEAAAPVFPSPEAAQCARLFLELMDRAATLAGVSSNLLRLLAEYRRTERRARALEDVLLPEIEDTLHDMEARLEDLEQEETIRTRLGRFR